MFGALYAAEGTDPAMLGSVAREFSPRIEVCGPREITLDLSGLERLFGEARMIAHELRRTAADRGLRVRVAIAVPDPKHLSEEQTELLRRLAELEGKPVRAHDRGVLDKVRDLFA